MGSKASEAALAIQLQERTQKPPKIGLMNLTEMGRR